MLVDRCLDSVARQTYKNIEVIVACHDCTDFTASMVEGYAQGTKHLSWKIVEVRRRHHYPDTPENRWFAGPVEPLNEALKHVTGDWIARIDDDDEWMPHHIENSLEYARQGKFEFVSAAHETHEGRVEPYKLDKATIGGTQTWLYRSYLKFFKWNPDCWRKERNKVNDTDISVRMMQAGVRMGYLPAVHAKVLPRPGETEVGLKAYTRKG